MRKEGQVWLTLLMMASGEGLGVTEEEVIELDPFAVVSTATRTDRLRVDLPIRTEVLGSELFRSAGAGDLAAALVYLPGVRVEANCLNCGTTEVKLQGLGAGYNQLLIDGHPHFGGLAAVYGLEQVPTTFIERIEVVKGGASSLYGPGAVAGVINIIPREPLLNQVIAEASMETFDGRTAYAAGGAWDWVHPQDKLAASLFTERRESQAIDLNRDGISEIPRKEFHTAGTNFWVNPGTGTRLRGNYAFTWENRRGGDRFDLPPHEAKIAEQLEHRWHRGGISLDQAIGADGGLKLGAAVSSMERDSYYGGVGNTPLPGEPGYEATAYAAAVEEAKLMYGFTESTRLYMDATYTLSMPRHFLSLGTQYKRDEVFDEKRNHLDIPLRTDGSTATRPGEDPIADEAYDNLGFSIQDEWDPTENWTVIAGARVDRHSGLESWILSPRLAVRHSLRSDLTLRASYSTGFRAPEIFDEDFHIEILDDPTRTRNAPGLREESSTSYAAGFVWTPAAVRGRLQMDVEIYRTNIRDTFHVSDKVFRDEADGAFKLRQNAGGSSVSGIEANLLYRFTEALTMEAGVNFTDGRFNEAQEIIPGIRESRYVESPRWSSVLRIDYSNEEFVDVFLGVVHTGPMIAVNESEGFLNRDTGHFFVVDFSMTRHMDLPGGAHMHLSLGIRNLFDQRQKDLAPGPERDPGYVYGPRLPRSIFLKGDIRF